MSVRSFFGLQGFTGERFEFFSMIFFRRRVAEWWQRLTDLILGAMKKASAAAFISLWVYGRSLPFCSSAHAHARPSNPQRPAPGASEDGAAISPFAIDAARTFHRAS